MKRKKGRPRRGQEQMETYRLKEFPKDLDLANVDVCVWNKYGDHPEDRVRWEKLHVSLEGDISIPKSYGARVVKHFQRKGYEPQELCKDCGVEYRYHGWIPEESGMKMEGVDLSGHKVCPGDYILRNDRTYWPCRPKTFHQLYEKIHD
jgi:hypothetical protein